MNVADAHAHLSELRDLEAVIHRAAQAGVFAITSVGTDLASNLRTLQLSEEFKSLPVKILPALGLHPWGLVEADIIPTLDHMRGNLQGTAGVGEVGLDYWLKDVKKDPSIKDVQLSAFKEVVKLAKEFDKPITVHSRGAWEDCFNIVVELGAKKVIFHWFSGPVELAKRIVDRDFYISATPALEYSKDLRAVVANTPLDHLLVETDSPVKYGDTPAEPKDVIISLREMSKLKGVTIEETAEETTQNFSNIYRSWL